MEKAWGFQDTDRHLYRHGLRRATEGLPFADEKNPARAYTLSLFFWGMGQSYNGQRIKSVVFQLFMIIFLAGITFSALYGKELLSLLQENGIARAQVFLSAELLLLGVLMFWIFNAVDAYHATAKSRRVPFRGVTSRALPMLSSILIPGWGQFMNGQPLKGTLLSSFSVLGFFSFITIPAVLLCWPYLEESGARALIEAIFAVTVLYGAIIPVIWFLSSYDALKISLDDAKKDTPLDRIVLAINRVRVEGWMQSLIPAIKFTVLLGVMLTLLSFLIKNNHFPAYYVYDHLAGAQAWLHEQGMTLVPDLISRLLSKTTLPMN